MTPLEAASAYGHLFACSFDQLYKRDSKVAVVMFLSAFVACYSRMEVVDRMSALGWMKDMIGDIGAEKFEDGADFVDFVKDKFAEKSGEE